jgi:hypothetical protein
VSFSQAEGPSGDDMNWSAFVSFCFFFSGQREREELGKRKAAMVFF